MQMPAGEFKAKCLKLMDMIKKMHGEIVITKHGKPVAKLVPVDEKSAKGKSIYGFLKDAVQIKGDIVSSSDEKWDADE